MANNDLPSQGFQVGSSAPVFIRAHQNPQTGEYCILWSDVQHAFNGVRRVQNGPEVVSFLTDDDLNTLQPLRIGFFPELILQVILDPPTSWAKVAFGKGLMISGVAFGPVMVLGGIAAAPFLVTSAVTGAGFGPGGIIAGTKAAKFMASYGGAVTKGSACSIMQSIGAAGLGTTGKVIVSAVAGAVAARGATALYTEGKTLVASASESEGN
ncbi:hypothetical protein BGX34_011121 [Mortierella sp. NVP85]|nr:hypothetical protein BGX34_011121 [Mortierella sp. NVP85]